ncbi:MAG: type IV secretion protein IcmB [Methylotenera sp.]|uniref:hypothetical protein n=1 Tax=Methylotenera sp. TaxID=2051956 RepID=UPI000D47C14E|nr:hypothetical protein [Methylotenera sp.]PPC84773.1 MAG: type IV secretion protein IcmB [Methylotenera sp.]PPD02132.1 MAG: type IV secretion protein IcmB [Methylotenera sp.]
MAITHSFIDATEEILYWISTMFKQHMADYIDIETADSKYSLVTKDGSLFTVINVSGSRRIVGSEEFNAISKTINSALEAALSAGGHSVQVFFQHDQERVEDQLRRMYEPSKKAASAMGFGIEDIIDDRVNALKKHCYIEDCFFVLKTKVSAISKAELSRSKKLQQEAIAKKKGAYAALSQNPIIAVDGLRDRHDSFVNTFLNDIREAGLIAEKLDVHSACREIRKTIDPDFTDEAWQPSLVGDKLPIRLPYVEHDDISNVIWPKLSSQLAPRSGEAIDHKYFSIGNRTFASVAVEIPPKDPKFFNVLFKRMLASKIPWRVSFNIESGGLKSVQLKRTMAAIIGFMHSGNSLIVDAYKELEEQVKYGAVDARFSMCFSTWVSDGDLGKLSSRASSLARAVEGWGICDVNEVPGDSAEGFMSTALGNTSEGCAVPCAANLADVVSLLPITRPSSPWATGTVMFRTSDGKIWPYQPGSTKQIAWIDLFVAGMGSGKSVQMNMINMALCSDPRLKRLPRIGIIDIGPSSEGLIALIRDQLPEGRKHEVAYHRLRMTEECAINSFDTLLCNRYPIASHRAFLSNFLLLLATPVGKESAYDGISEMAGMVIDETYKRLSDDYAPKPYSPGIDTEVDDMIAELGIKIDRKTSWWEVVDALFAAGKTRHAGLAQRFAVPILDDVIESSRSESIRDLFDMNAPTNETLVAAFGRMISSAIREYPIISRPTRFDISESRVVSLDLDEVAKTGGDKADRQTAIMYMLARFVLARDYYLTEENLSEINPKAAAYHRIRIKESAEDIKRLCVDEFHRTKRVEAVRQQFVTDIREGRKWAVHIALASQNMDDFDDIMISLSTSIFIMGKFDQRDVEALCTRFGLGETARYALMNSTHGPRPGVGTTFLMNLATNDSNQRNSQLVTSTMGSIEYWAFSTTMSDKIIRSMMYAKIGGKEARKLLSKTYPWGIADEVARRAEEVKEVAFNEDASSGIIGDIFNELIAVYHKEVMHAA